LRITELKEKGGSSRQAILKYVIANNKVDAAKAPGQLRLAIKRALAGGVIVSAKDAGKGSGKFKVGEKDKPLKEKKAAKPKAKKAKKPAAKKAAKKPAVKKAVEKKVAPKKAAKKVAKKPAKKAAKPEKKVAKPKKGAKKAAAKKK
jgi:histone H1/5